MTHRRRPLRRLAAAATAAALAVIPFAGPPAARGQAGATGGAAHVGVFSVSQVLRKTQELKSLQAKFKDQDSLLQAIHAGHQATLTDMQQKLPGLKAGTDTYEGAVRDLQIKAAQFQMEESLKKFDIMHEMSRNIKALYDEMQTAVATVAKRKGIDLVLVDNDPELPEGPLNLSPEDMQKVLSQKNIYYVTPSAVVTDEVATELDKMFHDHGGVPAPTAPAGGGIQPASPTGH